MTAGLLGGAIIAFGQVAAPVPFRSCSPSSPQVLSLAIDQIPTTDATVTLNIVMKNVAATVLIVEKRDPERLFAARVVGASGAPAKLTRKGETLYSPLRPNQVYVESSVGPVELAPEETITFKWRLSDIFDLSKPGTYNVSLKQVIATESLNTTVCSNTVSVNIKP